MCLFTLQDLRNQEYMKVKKHRLLML
ncbi:hypothetical protein DSM3645_28267 [Blastopirellula marina DSM 3645]|uniref:Uncharacterized protein n=1 Tax=Blastopirellula marina DSM 3645 TaxID=314230 RepID=A3ZP06_9BACT|nr:hypothetical protein DSM3645_28267 [Blastopirellula marina DSM 3645]